MMWKKLSVAAIVLLAWAASLSAQRVIFSDDMSNFPTGWTLGTSGGRSDTWTQNTTRWYSSSFSAKCTRSDTTYPDSSDCWMARSVVLTGYPMGVMTFRAWQRSEGGYDFLQFEYSTDAGSTWSTLWSRSGNYNSWQKVTISNIPSNANRIRLRFTSDPSGHFEGVYLDDMILYGMDTTGTTVFFDDMTYFPNQWVLRGTNNHSWDGDTFRYHSPGYSAQCAGRDTGYYINMDSRASRVIDLRGSGYNCLSFWLWNAVEEDYDYLNVDYHVFSGTWSTLLHDSADNAYWRPYNFELPGNADSIRFRFRSDTTNDDQGAYVDDVSVNDFGARALDVAPVAFTGLPPDVDSGAAVPLAAVIRNNGAVKVSVPVYLSIADGSSYRMMMMVDSIAAGGTAPVTFPSWIANVRPGIYLVRCSTAYFMDSQTANDVLLDSVVVANSDIGVVSIVRPMGLVPPGTVVPEVILRNHGNSRTAANVTFQIPLASYAQNVQFLAGLPVRVDTTIDFPAWIAPPGIYTASCSTYMVGDQIKADNVLPVSFLVGDTGWTLAAPVPPGFKGKAVKDGGCLAYDEVGDTGRIYALKGNNRAEFYSYNTVSNAWTAMESIPAIGFSGKKKCVKKGACMTQMDGNIYAAKGNNSVEWWSYSPGLLPYPWHQLADVPLGAKTVREGAGVVPVRIGATDYIYLLKGSGTWEFYRYNIALNSWEALASAPPGLSGKSFKNGSCLACDSTTGTVYALKASYNEFSAFNVATGVWSDRQALPLIGTSGKKKKVKDGAGMARTNGMVYALKGDNTREFWAYQPDANQWAQSSDLPLGIGKNVKGGGALAYSPSDNALYALKGNNTFEFARLQLSADAYRSPLAANRPDIENSSSLVTRNLSLSIAPNPFTGATAISYTLPEAANVSLSVYDVTGKLVAPLARGYRSAGTYSLHPLIASSLARGIYLVRLETPARELVRKMVIE